MDRKSFEPRSKENSIRECVGMEASRSPSALEGESPTTVSSDRNCPEEVLRRYEVDLRQEIVVVVAKFKAMAR